MSSYLKLHSHYVEDRGGQIAVCNAWITVALGNGTSVRLALPFVPLGGGLAIVPRVTTNGESSVQFDFTRWSPAYLRGGTAVVLPVELSGQALAARFCQEFHASPDVSWSDPAEKVRAWRLAWSKANDVAP